MVATWSEGKTNDSESNEEHAANICLIAKEVQENERPKYESTNKVDISAIYECYKEELLDTLVTFIKLEQR